MLCQSLLRDREAPAQKGGEDKEEKNDIFLQDKNREQTEKKWSFWPIFSYVGYQISKQ